MELFPVDGIFLYWQIIEYIYEDYMIRHIGMSYLTKYLLMKSLETFGYTIFRGWSVLIDSALWRLVVSFIMNIHDTNRQRNSKFNISMNFLNIQIVSKKVTDCTDAVGYLFFTLRWRFSVSQNKMVFQIVRNYQRPLI